MTQQARNIFLIELINFVFACKGTHNFPNYRRFLTFIKLNYMIKCKKKSAV